MDLDIETIVLPGLTHYADALALQRERRAAVEEGRLGNALLLLEHAPVITRGRNAHDTNILSTPEELDAMGIEVCEADRGGDVTYHGPGQLVAYPILNLQLLKPSIRWYLRTLEEVLIRLLARYGIEAGRKEGLTGVWAGNAKIAAIGIGVHNWVTFHGLALNVDPCMDHFKAIIPCGIEDKPVTSLRQITGLLVPMDKVMDDLSQVFIETLFQDPEPMGL